MPDDEKTTKPEDQPVKDDDAPAGKDGSPDYEAEAAKWKALSRKHEGQAKANADAAKKLADMEDADKSEVQKLTDKATESDKAAAAAQQELARLRVAMRKGLTEAQAKRLIGATEEELEADADELLASFPKGADDKDTAAGPTRPKEKLKSGATGADKDNLPQLTRDDLKAMKPEQIEAARVAHQLDQIQGIK
jgi:hypothetical protein